MKDFKELEVWKEAKRLVIMVYKLTETYPKTELFGLVNQMRRSAISIPSNIAEGVGRKTEKDAAHFMFTSRGSLFELETQTIISMDLNYISKDKFIEIGAQIEYCRRLINGMINYYEKPK